MQIEKQLEKLGLQLPPPIKVPPSVKLPFSFVRVRDGNAYISGHGPQNEDGSIAGPFGKLGVELSVEQGYAAASLVALSMLGSLKRELGDLDRISAWLRVHGMVNCAPGLRTTARRDQRLFRYDLGALWRRARRPYSLSRRHGSAAL